MDVAVHPASRLLASGDGWTASDIVCGAGPRDRPFEEQHSRTAIAIVLSGTFQYRTAAGAELMTPGSLLLGNAGDCFTCGHEHGTGDRCLSFCYSEEFRDHFAAPGARSRFQVPRVPPTRQWSSLVVKASELLPGADRALFEELGIGLLMQVIQAQTAGAARAVELKPSALARVTRVVRIIDNEPNAPHDLIGLARIARLSPYHFLRTFEAVTGTTPHQYLLRIRLRRAALRLCRELAKILDIALEGGFRDVSNFNRAFRAEFGVSPRAYRSGDRLAPARTG